MTKKKNSKKQIDLSKEKLLLQQTEDIAKIGSWEWDMITNDFFWSDGMYKILGYKPQEFKVDRIKNMQIVHPDDRKILTEFISLSIESGTTNNLQIRLLSKKKGIKHVLVNAKVIKDSSLNIHKLIGVYKDVTDRIILENKVIESEKRLSVIAKEGADLIAILSVEGHYKYISPNYIKHLGYLDSDLLNKNAFDYVHEDDRLQLFEQFNKLLTEDQVKSIPYRFKHKSKGWRWLQSTGTNLINDNLISGIVINSVDITDLILTQQKLLHNNELYELINKSTNDAIYDWDVVNDIFYWGEGFFKLFGYKKRKANFRLSDWAKLTHPIDRQKHQQSWNAFLNDNKRHKWLNSFRFKNASDEYLYVEEIAYLIRDEHGNPIRMVGVLRNISESKRIETIKQLQFQISQIFKKEINLKTTLQYVLEFLVEYSGFKTAEIWLMSSLGTHLNLLSYYAGDAVSMNFFVQSENINKIYKGEGIPGKVWENNNMIIWNNLPKNKLFIRRKAAAKAKLTIGIGIPLYHNHKFMGVLMLCADEEMEKDKESIEPFYFLGDYLGGEIIRKKQEEEMYLLFQSAPEIIAIATPNGTFAKVNETFCNILGYSEKDLTSKPFEYFIHPDDIKKTNNEYNETISGNRRADSFINRYRTINGNYKWISWSSSSVFGEDGYVFAYGRDVTKIKQLQKMLDYASSLAKVGGWEIDLISKKHDWSEMTREIFEVNYDFIPSNMNAFSFFREDYMHLFNQKIHEAINNKVTFDFEAPIITAKGNLKWLRVMGIPEFLEGKCIKIHGSIQDVHAMKSTERELAYKNELLSSISKVISIFLQIDDLYIALQNVFQITGNAVGVDRVYFFENHPHPITGELVCSQRYEWTKDSVTPQIHNTKYQNVPLSTYPEFFTNLAMGEMYSAITSRLAEGEFKNALIEQDIKSFIVIPIIYNGKNQGFVGFDDCNTERIWNESEVLFLHNITSSLSSAIQRKNNQSELKKAYDDRTTILESIRDGFFAVDKNWKVNYWNKSAEQMLLTPRNEILDKNLWDVFSREANIISYDNYLKALQNKEVIHFEDFFKPQNKWFEISAYPSETGLSVYFKDITVKKYAETQLKLVKERLEKVTEATQDAVRDWDIISDTLHWGGDFKNLFGYEIGNACSLQSWIEHIHPNDKQDVINSLFESIKDKKILNWQFEYRYKRVNGNYAYVLDKSLFIRNDNGEAQRMVGAMRDITHRKDYEVSLMRLNDTLRLKTIELARSNEELEQFAYIASHDLQEPLRMVTGFLTQLEKKYLNQLDDKAIQYIHFAVDGAKRMRQIILDLLNFSRVGKHEDSYTEVDINEVMQEVTVLQRKNIEEKNASIIYDNLPVIMTLRSPVLQIFNNLINNALKYSKDNITPKIEIKAESIDNEWLFSVKDNGIGIDKEYYNKIFVIFQRLHNKEEYSGTGIGLAIVKKIIDNFGGRIWLNSEVGKGSTFYFTIPIKIT